MGKPSSTSLLVLNFGYRGKIVLGFWGPGSIVKKLRCGVAQG